MVKKGMHLFVTTYTANSEHFPLTLTLSPRERGMVEKGMYLFVTTYTANSEHFPLTLTLSSQGEGSGEKGGASPFCFISVRE